MERAPLLLLLPRPRRPPRLPSTRRDDSRFLPAVANRDEGGGANWGSTGPLSRGGTAIQLPTEPRALPLGSQVPSEPRSSSSSAEAPPGNPGRGEGK